MWPVCMPVFSNTALWHKFVLALLDFSVLFLLHCGYSQNSAFLSFFCSFHAWKLHWRWIIEMYLLCACMHICTMYTDRILYSTELHEIISELKLQSDFYSSCKQNKCAKKTDFSWLVLYWDDFVLMYVCAPTFTVRPEKINGKNINHRFLLFEIRNNHYKRKNLISKTKWEEKKNQISGFWYRDYFTPKPLQNCFSAAIHNSIGISLMNGLVAWNRLNFV